jgi:hypothetical protein
MARVRVLGVGEAGWPGPTQPSGHRPCWLGGGARCNPSPLYKGPPGEMENTQHHSWPRVSSPLSLVHRPSPPLSFPPAWPPKGLCRSETTPPLHVTVLWSFRIPSEAIYFHNLGWIGDSGGHRDHRMCLSTRRFCSLCRRSRRTKFFNDLEVGYVDFINIACAGALIPCSIFKGMSPNTSLPLQYY